VIEAVVVYVDVAIAIVVYAAVVAYVLDVELDVDAIGLLQFIACAVCM
jgi:hypothetical protein